MCGLASSFLIARTDQHGHALGPELARGLESNYIRLEQGRGPHPSRQVLSALARALMLGAGERDYLFRIAGSAPPQPTRPSREITPGIRHLLDSMPATPAYVVDAAYNILAWNQLAIHFIGNLAGHADRNMIRWTFRRSPADSIWSDEHFLTSPSPRSPTCALTTPATRAIPRSKASSPRCSRSPAVRRDVGRARGRGPRADAQARPPPSGGAA
jgi:hypothetical protein